MNLITFYNNPVVNIVMICVFSLLIAVLIHKIKPYDSTAANFKNIIQELLWTAAVIFCIPFSNDLEDTQSMTLGWIVITLLGAMIFLNMIFLMYNLKHQSKLVKAEILEIWRLIKSLFGYQENNKKIRTPKLHVAKRRRIERILES